MVRARKRGCSSGIDFEEKSFLLWHLCQTKDRGKMSTWRFQIKLWCGVVCVGGPSLVPGKSPMGNGAAYLCAGIFILFVGCVIGHSYDLLVSPPVACGVVCVGGISSPKRSRRGILCLMCRYLKIMLRWHICGAGYG